MTKSFIRRHLSRHRLGLVCGIAAILGVGFGAVLSLQMLDRAKADGLTQVQRLQLDAIFLPEKASAPTNHGSDKLAAAELTESATRLPEPVQERSAGKVGDEQPGSGKVAASNAAYSRQHGIMLSNFDLGNAQRADEPIEISKAIFLNGQELGIASFSVDQGSRLRVSARDLARLLPAELHDRIKPGKPQIGFDELRDAGLDIRYDPLADTIQIRS